VVLSAVWLVLFDEPSRPVFADVILAEPSRAVLADELSRAAEADEAAWCDVSDALAAAVVPGRCEAWCTLPLSDCEATPAPIAALTGVAATGCDSALEPKFAAGLVPAWFTVIGARTPAPALELISYPLA
jgi:hypothetical protein